jgi:hypothetical protein
VIDSEEKIALELVEVEKSRLLVKEKEIELDAVKRRLAEKVDLLQSLKLRKTKMLDWIDFKRASIPEKYTRVAALEENLKVRSLRWGEAII